MPLPLGAARFLWPLLLLTWLSQVQAAPQPCEDSEWVPGRYYANGSVVHYQGKWYQSRERQEGNIPGAGFAWQVLQAKPDCRAGQATPHKAGKAASVKPSASVEENPDSPSQRKNCSLPEPWNFARVYSVGDLVRYQDQSYRAIRPGSGAMPAMTKPPHWQPVDHACP